jgi:6-phosphogluconate dehydrogenase
MGANLARAAVDHGHEVVGHDHDEQLLGELAHEGVVAAPDVEALVRRLQPPRLVILYVPHGPATELVCGQLRDALAPGDVVVDGGNSHWADSQRRHIEFAHAEVRFLDMGTSGGLRGARHGARFMAGGDREAFALVEPLLKDLAFDDRGVLFTGAPGERSEVDLDLPALLDNWLHGSVIRSWLIELMRDAYREHPDPDRLSTYVEDTGEVKWVLEWALERASPPPWSRRASRR